ncbi:hypothetical protein [Actinokineospora terrae]|uniref:Uncharacterized protein n=1 Tax=Actinokineospora terrae TaxID=155974 RepID=A0A1H9VGI9_9PSEU|nr:hypothetical protein [Actinokineospora terrae]SES20679.1 hypothetical protein SAMN04487818_108344 [Actinokineospora terrae]
MTSAYPVAMDTLVAQVKARAIELGELPSRNRIKTEFKVGAPKATAVLAELEGFDPTRRLHAVPPTDFERAAEPVHGTESDQPAPVEPTSPAATTEQGDAEQVDSAVSPGPAPAPVAVTTVGTRRRERVWTHSLALLMIAVSAFVAIWGGWVGLGTLTGFGEVALLPGIVDGFTIDSAITLPLGMEAYAAFALRVWLTGTRTRTARRFAKWSAIGALALGGFGQVAYHLMTAAGITVAPWGITTFVSCLPVAVLGCAAALLHLLREHPDEEVTR